MEWNNELALKLIDEYKSFPILWNTKHPLHFSRGKKMDAWDAICNNLNLNIFEVKQKMNSLLGSLRREKSRGKSRIGTGIGAKNVFVSKWFAFKRMEFLLHKHDPIDSVSAEQSDNSEDLIYLDEDDNSQVLDETKNTESNENSQASTSEKRTSEQVNLIPPNQKKRKSNENENEARSEEAYCISKETATTSREPIPTEDSCSIYGMHVVNKLRTYNKRTRIEVENAINKILYAADIGEYDVYTINPPLSPDPEKLQYSATDFIEVVKTEIN